MSIVRENYYAPLWTLISAPGVFKTKNRRVQLMQNMEDGELPAIFMMVDKQPTTPSINSPAKYRLGAKVFLYCANPDEETSADMALNGLIDTIEAALEAFPNQTLGRDDVERTSIEGEVETFAGPNGTRAAAIVPIQILMFLAEGEIMADLTKQQTEALAKFRRLLGNNAAALTHYDRYAPELVRRLDNPPPRHPKDDRDPTYALVWDWFNAHYPGSPASIDTVLWSALTEEKGAVAQLIAALQPATAAPAAKEQE